MAMAHNKVCKHDFRMLAELSKYSFQCSTSSPSGPSWSRASL